MVPETEASEWKENTGVLEEGETGGNDAGYLVRVQWRNTRTHRKVT